jgi:hypothetical protein
MYPYTFRQQIAEKTGRGSILHSPLFTAYMHHLTLDDPNLAKFEKNKAGHFYTDIVHTIMSHSFIAKNTIRKTHNKVHLEINPTVQKRWIFQGTSSREGCPVRKAFP